MKKGAKQRKQLILDNLIVAKQNPTNANVQAFYQACFNFLGKKIEKTVNEHFSSDQEAQIELIYTKIKGIKLKQFPVQSASILAKYLKAVVFNHCNSNLVDKLECALTTNTMATKNAFFNALYETLFSKVQLIVASYYPNESEDIAADIFAKILRKDLSVFPCVSDFHLERYLMKIAVNHCNTQYRLRKNKPSSLDIDDIGEGSFIKNHTERLELALDLEKMIALLPQQQEMAIRYWSEGYSYKEIAELMDTTVASIRNIIWRAKARLLTILQSEDKQINQTIGLKVA